jgi:hypothetical protein
MKRYLVCTPWYQIRVAGNNKYPKTAPDFESYSRRGNRRMAAPCNCCHDKEDGSKDKQDWIIYFFRGPKE